MRQFTPIFNEEFYLSTYADVAESIRSGVYPDGWAHFLATGQAEGRLGIRPPLTEAEISAANFDDAWYLAANPDVARGVAEGDYSSGHDHWFRAGRAENRIAPPDYDKGDRFDAKWYRDSYHAAALDIANGRAADLLDHYTRIGRYRGYLPNRFAPRPDNPATIPSRFGGLWPDHANAGDLIEGRLELGRISQAQAQLLRDWAQNGYVVLRQALAPEIVDRAAEELRRAYNGEIQDLLFECVKLGGYAPVKWDPAVKHNPAKALDLHWLSEPIRDLIFAAPIRDYLELVFERRALASQSLTFLHGSTQGYHQDTLYVPFSLPRQFIASWVALEDVTPGGGELTYFPGSHQMPDHLYAGQFKTLWDAERMLQQKSLREEMSTYSESMAQRNLQAGLTPETFLATKGDVLLWHADLAHGGMPISINSTRASVVTHYCPREVASLTFERGGTAMRSHRDVAWYATGNYAG
jgi:phytanoyl-CoA hydroxylase